MIDHDYEQEVHYHPENYREMTAEEQAELDEENERDFEAIGGMDRF